MRMSGLTRCASSGSSGCRKSLARTDRAGGIPHPSAQPDGSVPDAGRFFADFLAVAPGVVAQRMGEQRGAVDLFIADVIGGGALVGIEARGVAQALGDLVVRARRIPACAEAADAFFVAIQ